MPQNDFALFNSKQIHFKEFMRSLEFMIYVA